MEVTQSDFHWQLQHMLMSLLQAHFVAIDLELSGIQSKEIHKVKPVTKKHGLNTSAKHHGAKKQTLQQRYEEIKEAAEKYQVLQIGLTFVREDQETGTYTARPYNIFLNPVLQERIDIERVFSFQSGAVEFLMNNGFRMDLPFVQGVPYLSRSEQVLAIQLEESRLDKSLIADIHLGAQDVESKIFIRRVRVEIKNWIDKKSNYPPEYLNIHATAQSANGFAERGMNSFQKRLVHQLVRAEHGGLVSISRAGFMQIMPLDLKREEAIKTSKMKSFTEKVARQVGLRWLIEGMIGGDIDQVNPLSFARSQDGEPIWINVKEEESKFEKLKKTLSGQRTVLVGHNLFMDLVNFYKCFLGRLPDTVEEFQKKIHRIFPLVIDTKYMATADNPSPNAKSGLADLDIRTSKMSEPIIETHPDHKKYNDATPAHEAGYDSFVTSKVAIRLAVSLEAAGDYLDHDETYLTASEGSCDNPKTPPQRNQPPTTPPNPPQPDPNALIDTTWVEDDSNSATSRQALIAGLIKIPIPDKKVTLGPAVAVKSKTKKKKASATRVATAFSHPGKFDILDSVVSEGSEEEATICAGNEDREVEVEADEVEDEQKVVKLMPRWDSEFWKVYGNKLRVNGTVEGVCDLLVHPKKTSLI